MPSGPVFTSKRHDTAVTAPLTLYPAEGVNWDLHEPGITVRLYARLPAPGSPLKMNGLCTVVGPWSITYTPTALDVDTIGAYDIEIEVRRADGRKVSFPTKGWLSWVIEPDLDNA